MSALLPCPFCGKSEASVIDCPSYFTDMGEQYLAYTEFYVVCMRVSGGCGAKTAISQSKENATRKWNQRAEKAGKSNKAKPMKSKALIPLSGKSPMT